MTTVFTDGACSGNPGPGGWAWAIPGGRWASGGEASSTNQRMEIKAALEAVRAIEGPLEIVSDSTYVVHCFRDRWYEGWLRRDWRNSRREPVANRDLWEPLINLVLDRGDVHFRWVKGHSGNPDNDLVDALAVRAAATQVDLSGDEPVPVGALDQADMAEQVRNEVEPPSDRSYRPSCHSIVIVGHRPPEIGGYQESETSARIRRKLAEILDARRDQFGDVVVLTGLGLGAETLGAEAATLVGVPYVAVLPFPKPDAQWPHASRRRFSELLEGAWHCVVLGRTTPRTAGEFGSAMKRRDEWLARVGDEAVLVWDQSDGLLAGVHAIFRARMGDDIWIVEPPKVKR